MRKTTFYARLFTACICFMMSSLMMAQTAQQPWSIGVSVGKAAYNGDLGNGFFNFDQAFHGNVGINVNRYMSRFIDLSANMTYGRHGYWKDPNYNFLSMLTQGNLALNLKLNNGAILPEASKVAPYIFAGIGFANYTPVDDRATKGTDFSMPLGLGANLAVSDKVSVFWQSSYNFTSGDDSDIMIGDVDNNNMVRGNDAFMIHQIGMKFNLGKMVDTDGDGIADKKDACPMVAGKTEFMGCPDTDGDGIIDSDDACPNVKGMMTHKGCPDTDGDGVVDSEDACPNKKGAMSMSGCPDSDNDGVADSKDKCPTVKGTKSNSGCPEVSQSALRVFKEALTGVHFETSKAVIKTSSYGILDKVVMVMKENPAYQLSIEGHTDSQGADASNMTLSDKRATAVMNYLSRKGVSTSRMSARGFGETRPIADNSTKEGRAQNRRVEFTVSFE